MTQTTSLHLLCISPCERPAILNDILRVWSDGDQLLLLADAAQDVTSATIQTFLQQMAQLSTPQTSNKPLLILDRDAALLPLPTILPDTLQIISSLEWANLVLTHQRSITWR